MIGLEIVYVLSAIVLFAFAIATFADRSNEARVGTGAFWLILGAIFALGSFMPAWLTGVLVVAMIVLDSLGLVRRSKPEEISIEERTRSAERLRGRLFLPILAVPVITYGCSQLPRIVRGIDANRALFTGMGAASILASLIAMAVTRAKPRELLREGRRLCDAIGPAVILPQLLASLGILMTRAGVGTVIAASLRRALPHGSLLIVVLVLCVTIASFTFVMGNSFAAFPVIMSGIGVPLLIEPFGASAPLVGALAMTAASCGTLCTPMAANFNIVPAGLLEMRKPHAILRFQAPYAVVMFVIHVTLLWALVAMHR